MKERILKEMHNSPLVGHSGYLKTYRQIWERFSSMGLKNDVLHFVQECSTCQQHKSEHTLTARLLQPMPIPNQKLDSISMDFITGLPKVQGRDCIFVVVDHLTKYAHFLAISTRCQAAQVAELFFREVFCLHGLPRNIVSDRVSHFLNTFWMDLFRLIGIELSPSMSYHPQMDGQTKIVNKWMEGYLRNYVSA